MRPSIGRLGREWTLGIGGDRRGLEAWMLGTKRKYRVFARTVGKSHAAIVVGTRVRAWTGASSCTNPERARARAGEGGTCGCQRYACGWRK